jgi:hypothetical protein
VTPEDILENISDDDLIRQYFANAEAKERIIAEKFKKMRERVKKEKDVEVL